MCGLKFLQVYSVVYGQQMAIHYHSIRTELNATSHSYKNRTSLRLVPVYGLAYFQPICKKNIVKIKLVDWKYNFEVFNSFLHYIKVYKVLYTKALLYLRSLFQRMVAMPCYDLAASILILIKTVEEKASLNVSKLECWLQVSKAKNN